MGLSPPEEPLNPNHPVKKDLLSSPCSFSSAETFGFTSSWFWTDLSLFPENIPEAERSFCPCFLPLLSHCWHIRNRWRERGATAAESQRPLRGQSWGHWDDKEGEGGFQLEKTLMPADICEQGEGMPENPGNLRAWEEYTGMLEQEQELWVWSPALPGNPKASVPREI